MNLKAGHKEQVPELISQALPLVNNGNDKSWKIQRLLDIANYYREVGQKEQALVVASQTLQFVNTTDFGEESYLKDHWLANIAMQYVAFTGRDRLV